jgi:hypothetical protein
LRWAYSPAQAPPDLVLSCVVVGGVEVGDGCGIGCTVVIVVGACVVIVVFGVVAVVVGAYFATLPVESVFVLERRREIAEKEKVKGVVCVGKRGGTEGQEGFGWVTVVRLSFVLLLPPVKVAIEYHKHCTNYTNLSV